MKKKKLQQQGKEINWYAIELSSEEYSDKNFPWYEVVTNPKKYMKKNQELTK
jgi:hypothetical protein